MERSSETRAARLILFFYLFNLSTPWVFPIASTPQKKIPRPPTRPARACDEVGAKSSFGNSSLLPQLLATPPPRLRKRDLFSFRRFFSPSGSESESVILYPTFAMRDTENPRKWRVRIHGWIFRPRDIELESVVAVAGLMRFYKIIPRSTEHAVFLRRIQNFVFKNRKGASVMLRCCDLQNIGDGAASKSECGVALLSSLTSDKFGHFEREELVHECELPPTVATIHESRPTGAPLAVSVRTAVPREGSGVKEGESSGTIFFIPATGWSVVSDIDDTVKVTQVLEREELIQNTFMREFTAVPGMQRLFQGWASEGAAFHYVSSSPWQLQPEIAEFFARCGLPGGSFHLRDFDIRNRNFFKYMFTKSTKSKPRAIEVS